MSMIWLSLAIVATVAYHVVMRFTPADANPYLSLAVTCGLATAVFAIAYAVLPGGAATRPGFGALNWTCVALGIVVVCVDFGFLMLYRSGFDVSTGMIITEAAAALLLVLVGVAYFAEKITLVNVAGIVLCVVGLWLINRK